MKAKGIEAVKALIEGRILKNGYKSLSIKMIDGLPYLRTERKEGGGIDFDSHIFLGFQEEYEVDCDQKN